MAPTTGGRWDRVGHARFSCMWSQWFAPLGDLLGWISLDPQTTRYHPIIFWGSNPFLSWNFEGSGLFFSVEIGMEGAAGGCKQPRDTYHKQHVNKLSPLGRMNATCSWRIIGMSFIKHIKTSYPTGHHLQLRPEDGRMASWPRQSLLA